MTATDTRRAEIARFYDRNHHFLAQRVWLLARPGEKDLVADACAFAWLQLARRPDIRLDRQGLSWLAVVAKHELWRLREITRRERPSGVFVSDVIDEHELLEPPSGLDPGRALTLRL